MPLVDKPGDLSRVLDPFPLVFEDREFSGRRQLRKSTIAINPPDFIDFELELLIDKQTSHLNDKGTPGETSRMVRRLKARLDVDRDFRHSSAVSPFLRPNLRLVNHSMIASMKPLCLLSYGAGESRAYSRLRHDCAESLSLMDDHSPSTARPRRFWFWFSHPSRSISFQRFGFPMGS